MDTHTEAIWQRDSVKKIVREARRRFWGTVGENPTTAYVAIASTHYSLIKRYMDKWWKKPLALGQFLQAVTYARIAVWYGLKDFNQVDVVARILSRSFRWDVRRAKGLLLKALSHSAPSESAEMLPHTRALMLVTLGDIECQQRNIYRAWGCYNAVKDLIHAIEAEHADDSERQLVRVLTAIGFFYYDHSDPGSPNRNWAEIALLRALVLARRVSKDQTTKILTELWKRGVPHEFS